VKYVDEYRDPALVRALTARLKAALRRPWCIMEICGGQTHTILKSGLLDLLPSEITLLHGPGCPVCVTPAEQIDRAVEISLLPRTTLCSFGDMLRVPGSSRSLLDAKAAGGDVRIVYSPMDALKLARAHADREVVFFAIGFETTAPANAMAVWQAARDGVRNFSVLSAHVLVPPAMQAILESPDCAVQAFLAPGHVCTVAGYDAYETLAARYRTPIVVTGFEPADLIEGILIAVEQLESGRSEVANQYARVVRRDGNPLALAVVNEVFETCARQWRGIGEIPASGLRLRSAYAAFDAETRFGVGEVRAAEPAECIGGLILRGLKKPYECPAFGGACSPEHPLGAPMVSSEGSCAAYYLYGRKSIPA
jgi:hydrogenase expression/formation protein HypD